MVTAFKRRYCELNAKGHHSMVSVLDNEFCHTVKQYITSKRTDMQFV